LAAAYRQSMSGTPESSRSSSEYSELSQKMEKLLTILESGGARSSASADDALTSIKEMREQVIEIVTKPLLDRITILEARNAEIEKKYLREVSNSAKEKARADAADAFRSNESMRHQQLWSAFLASQNINLPAKPNASESNV